MRYSYGVFRRQPQKKGHDNLVFFRNAFDLTSLGLDTLKMHRDGDYDVEDEYGQGRMRFYY